MPIFPAIRFGLLLLAWIAGSAQAAEWRFAAGSRLGFEGSQQGEAFTGEFKQFAADLQFDPAALAQAKFDVRIQIASVDSANSERDDAMRSGDWFNAAQFPQAHFRADQFLDLGAGNYSAEASLSLRGRTVAMAFPFRWQVDASGAHLHAKVKLDRLAFGVGAGEWEDEDLIGHQVTVSVDLNLLPIR
jgi:polyisoprenoid-binding protein YceI